MPRNQSEYEYIADDLRRQIATGRLKPGDRLPSTAQLAPRYRVSVQPVKTAILLLHTDGWTVGKQSRACSSPTHYQPDQIRRSAKWLAHLEPRRVLWMTAGDAV